MKRVIRFLDRVLSPVLILSYLCLCVVLLAAVPAEQKLTLFITMLWAAAMMATMRWGIWGILQIARTKTRAGHRELKFLVRTVEVLESIVSVTTVVFAILLRDIPAVWLFLPVALFGLQAAVRFDARYII